MLPRGLYDTLSFWPAVMWPIVFSSAYWAFLRLCMISQQHNGFSPLNGRRAMDRVTAWLYVPGGALLEATVHLYLLSVIGGIYALVALPIAVLGWLTLPVLLHDTGPAPAILPMIHLGGASAFAVLLGLVEIGPLRALNAEIYTLLVGVRVTL